MSRKHDETVNLHFLLVLEDVMSGYDAESAFTSAKTYGHTPNPLLFNYMLTGAGVRIGPRIDPARECHVQA